LLSTYMYVKRAAVYLKPFEINRYIIAAIVAAHGVNRMTRRRTIYRTYHDHDVKEALELWTEFCSASMKKLAIHFFFDVENYSSEKKLHQKVEPLDNLGVPKYCIISVKLCIIWHKLVFSFWYYLHSLVY